MKKFILIVMAFLCLAGVAYADDNLSLSVGYVHKWMLNTPKFTGQSILQFDINQQLSPLGLTLPQGSFSGDTTVGNEKITGSFFNTYADRDLSKDDSSGVRVEAMYDFFKPTKKVPIAIAGGADFSFARFSGSIESNPFNFSGQISNSSKLTINGGESRLEGYGIDLYQWTIKAEAKAKPLPWLEVGIGFGPTFNYFNGDATLDENVFLQTVGPPISGALSDRASISDFSVGLATYGVVRAKIYKSFWGFLGGRYDYMFSTIDKSVGPEKFSLRLSTVEVNAGVTYKF